VGIEGHIDSVVDRWMAFTLIVVPDLFMSLEAMQIQLEMLLVKYPLARLVLIGLPGLPNTLWPSDCVLTPKLHTSAIEKLLVHLYDTNRLSYEEEVLDGKVRNEVRRIEKGGGEPVFLMGFGTGVHTLLRFVSLNLPDLPWLESRVKAVCIVNGVIKMNKPFRKICRDLQKHLMHGGDIEVDASISALHLWEAYLSENNKEVSLGRFWKLREGLCVSQDKKGGAGINQHGRGYVGVLDQLKGLLIPVSEGEEFDGVSVLSTG
jgi:hypothetical protein